MEILPKKFRKTQRRILKLARCELRFQISYTAGETSFPSPANGWVNGPAHYAKKPTSTYRGLKAADILPRLEESQTFAIKDMVKMEFLTCECFLGYALDEKSVDTISVRIFVFRHAVHRFYLWKHTFKKLRSRCSFLQCWVMLLHFNS